MDTLLRLWAERAPREKQMIASAAAVIAAALVYLLLIEPAWTGISRLERGLPTTRAQAAQLAGLLTEAAALKSRPQVATVSTQDARAAIEKSLAAAGLKAKRIQPLADGDFQMAFADVPFATWTTWLAGVEGELGARAAAVTVNRTSAAGNADIELALRLARR